MECTQRLESTQLYGTQTERNPEQIGFLGICGTKYPVKRGPNKIGRDPQTCNIVLDLKSISRQHAVINILNTKDFMLMDLDSANKTKLENRTLQAYIPHPLKDGDTIQFGEVFGVFRLLEENDDLPMTQAIDIPDTPIMIRYTSKLKHNPVTTIPESPDVSDRDESFITPTQSKGVQQFKSPSNKYIKSSARTISIQPVGSNKIDNVYWNSSKKSTSFNLDGSSNSLNELSTSNQSINNPVNNEQGITIHEMETQSLCPTHNESKDSIYDADTQVPPNYNISNSIHNMNTQLPDLHKIDKKNMELDLYMANKENDNSIYNAETQPFISDQNSSVKSLLKERDEHIFDADTQIENPNDDSNILNDASIFNAETQIFTSDESKVKPKCMSNEQPKNNISNELIVFEDLDSHSFQDDFDSQPLLLPDEPLHNSKDIDKLDPKLTEKNKETGEVIYIKSNTPSDSKDIEILPTQKSPNKDDDVTDCEEDIIEFETKKTNTLNNLVINNAISQVGMKKSIESVAEVDLTDCEDLFAGDTIQSNNVDNCEYENMMKQKNIVKTYCDKSSNLTSNVSFEDMPTQVLEEDIVEGASTEQQTDKLMSGTNFEDMPTQVLEVDVVDCTSTKEEKDKLITESNFEDMPTQVLEDDVSFENLPTQVLEDNADCNIITGVNGLSRQNCAKEIFSPFKVPLQTPIKMKRRETTKANELNEPKVQHVETSHSKANDNNDDDNNYYDATQQLLDDLCSQQQYSPELLQTVKSKTPRITFPEKEIFGSNAELVIHSVVEKESKTDISLAPKNKVEGADTFSEKSDGDEKVNSYVTNLSNKQIRDVIGVDTSVTKLHKVPSDPSDVESTPKKVRPFRLMETDLPNSQEIKTSVSLSTKSLITESSSGSETENDSQDRSVPILFRKKKLKTNAKVNLTEKFDTKVLPSRVITRVRKPTSKVQESDAVSKKKNVSILKPKFLTEQEDEIDKDIITENISRLRNKTEKKNNKNGGEKEKRNNKNSRDDENKNNKKSGEKEKNDNKNSGTNENIGNKNSNENDKKNNKSSRDGLDIEAKKKAKINSKSNDSKKHMNIDRSYDIENETKPSKSDIGSNKNKASSSSSATKIEKTIKIDMSDNGKSDSNRMTSRKTMKNETLLKKITRNETLNETIAKAILSTSNPVRSNKSLDSVIESKRSTRSSRSKHKDDSLKIKIKLKSPEDKSTKRKRGRPKKEIETVDSPEKDIDIRRSRRRKQIEQTEKKGLKSHEKSTVYNISSESGTDSPKSLKRSAVGDLEVPSSKRIRPISSSNNSSLRSTPARAIRTPYVLFTAFPSEEVKTKLEKLGAIIVSDVKECTVVLTIQIKRTFKLLCAVGLGRPIVGPNWVQACVDTNMIVDPWLYLIKDEPTEKRFHFSLERTLTGKRNFLRGYNVSATSSVQPSGPEMKLIVECSGGTWKAQKPQWICVSCNADKAMWKTLKQQGAILVSCEFILSGVLRQTVDVDANRLEK